jgi:ELWxxDGT repeat protein
VGNPYRRLAAALLLCHLAVAGGGRAFAQIAPVPFGGSGGPSELAVMGSKILFLSVEERTVTLWESDGTPDGTRRIARLEGYASAGVVASLEGAVFFVTGFGLQYASGGGESYLTLWATDGTERGTVELATGSAPYYGSHVRQGIRQPDPGSVRFQVIGGEGIYFFVRSQTGLNGDRPRAEIFSYRPGQGPPSPVFAAPGRAHVPLLAVDQGRLYFTIGNEVWSSDGGPAVELLEFQVQWSQLGVPQEMNLAGRSFHVEADREHGAELWLRQGDSDGMVKDINPGVNSSDPCSFARLGDLLVFSAETLEHGREPWLSDGTRDGTRMLLDIAPGPEDSTPSSFAAVEGGLVFVTRYQQLWRTDGTAQGTELVSPSLTRSAEYRGTVSDPAALPPIRRPEGANVIALTAAGDLLFYLVAIYTETEQRGDTHVVTETLARTELWSTDGTPPGTTLLEAWQRTRADSYPLEDPLGPKDRYLQIP